METRVYVYALKDAPDALEHTATAQMGSPLYHWVANGARLSMGQGFPSNLEEQGAVFGPEGEIRWWRGENGYEAVLLSNQPMAEMEPLPGNWEGEETVITLQDLCEQRVRPNFSSYPHGKRTGRLQAIVYSRDGMAVFVSPRKLL